HDPAPFRAREMKEESGCDHNACSDQMNPRIVLTAHHLDYARNRVTEASDASRKLERASLHKIQLSRYGFLIIASRFGLNSLPDFHSGNLALFATSWPTTNRSCTSCTAPDRSQ